VTYAKIILQNLSKIYPILSILIMGSLMVACQSNPPTQPPPDQYPKKPPISVTQPKFALVIGNRDYEYAPLANTLNDATDVANTLRGIGFNEVLLKTDLTKRGMRDALDQFTQYLSKHPGSLGLFYFSGHGARVKGQNYLIPVDNYQIKKEHDLQYDALDSQQVLADMQWANTTLNILILDACRDNPYESYIKNLNRGLAETSSPNSTIIAFSTAPGTIASDKSRNGRNGLYTSHLIPLLKKANQDGMRIDDMFMTLRNAVHQESNGEQVPWYNASLEQPYCFSQCRTERNLEDEREREQREREARLEREREARLEREREARLEREREARLEREREAGLEQEREARLERERQQRLEREQCRYCNCEEILRKWGLGIERLTPAEETFRQTHCY